jgi:hypothetical protein
MQLFMVVAFWSLIFSTVPSSAQNASTRFRAACEAHKLEQMQGYGIRVRRCEAGPERCKAVPTYPEYAQECFIASVKCHKDDGTIQEVNCFGGFLSDGRIQFKD